MCVCLSPLSVRNPPHLLASAAGPCLGLRGRLRVVCLFLNLPLIGLLLPPSQNKGSYKLGPGAKKKKKKGGGGGLQVRRRGQWRAGVWRAGVRRAGLRGVPPRRWDGHRVRAALSDGDGNRCGATMVGLPVLCGVSLTCGVQAVKQLSDELAAVVGSFEMSRSQVRSLVPLLYAPLGRRIATDTADGTCLDGMVDRGRVVHVSVQRPHRDPSWPPRQRW